MSATPIAVSATLRGKAAITEVREPFDRLEEIDSDISAHAVATKSNTYGPYNITHDEAADVLRRRRDAVLTKLENKGIRIAPDPEPVYLGEMPKAAEA